MPTTSPARHEPLPRTSWSGGRAGWARNAATAAGIAADRPELWVPGGLASIAFLGWVPLVLAVVRVPSAGDLEFFGARLASAASFPLNLVVLAATAVLVLLAASVLVAAGEASLQARVDRLIGREPSPRSLDAAALRLWIVEVVAAIPALAALAATVLAIAAVAPAEYQSPNIGGTVLVRIIRDVWPALAAVALAVVLGIAWGGAAQRAGAGPAGRSPGGALLAGAAAVVRHPVRCLGLALATLVALAGWLAATWFLLQILWRPIGRAMAAGRILEAGMPLLLVGFVAVWLCLVAGGGALHGWASAWWSLELAEPDQMRPRTPEGRAEEADSPWT